jgi:TolB protein
MNRWRTAIRVLGWLGWVHCCLAFPTNRAWSQPPGAAGKPPNAPPLPLHVSGNRVLDSLNNRVHLRGVNVPSLEWTSDGEGHVLETTRVAIDDWHSRVIRLPLAQDRWFGKTADRNATAKSYQAIVKQIVDFCAARGCYVVLDLHWSDAGEWGKQVAQHVMPDQNSIVFWKDLSAAYKNHPAVLFDLYNEPHDVSWDVWQHGGKVSERGRRGMPPHSYDAVGMQTLLDTVRATGAKNVVMVGGLDWSYDLAGILAGRQLADPTGNGIIYANHVYPFKGDTVQQWVKKMEAATQKLAVNVSEFGSAPAGARGVSGEQWVRQVLQALHDHDWDYIAWDLHPRSGPTMISDWNYTPTPTFGKWVKLALRGELPPYTPPSSSSPGSKTQSQPSGALGMLENHRDIGTVLHAGATSFNPTTRRYTVTGSGENMWFNKDAFQFAWKEMKGDFSIGADIKFLDEAREPHRKACLMIRQGLDADAPYVDAVLHGDGLTSLQFRETSGAATHEIQSNVSRPTRLQLVKRGNYALLYLAQAGQELRYSGAAVRLAFADAPLEVGIGVCAHDKNATAKVEFTNLTIESPLPANSKAANLYSTLETQTISSTDRRVVHVTQGRIEAPNWLHDGQGLIFNVSGHIQRIALSGGAPVTIDTGFATRCNNDHGISPDGKTLVISDQSQDRRQSLIYTLPISGGTPRRVTANGPSYWHGWSPDGKTLAFCGERQGEFDIYTIPVEGGQETRLTTAKGLDDGPEFSPDGSTIYFNSERTGTMQIWRMKADGREQEQVTDDVFNNWFPHISPNGGSMVFLSYASDVKGHPANKDVTLRTMNLDNKRVTILGKFFGGQGTINVPCWSPDGRRIAFVTYQMIP